MRKIIHIDMDAFFASVEQRENPTLKSKPVIVGGKAENRGVVASASYEARKFGIRSAMSTAKAQRLCPNLLVVQPNFTLYRDVSQQIRAIFEEVTELVEPLSLDEAYLDVTSNKLNEPSATRLAQCIRNRIFEKTSLTASAGVGPNKFIAKIASDFRKPNGITVIPPEKVDSFVAALKVEKLWGVGPATAKRLHALRIFTAEDIRSKPKFELERHFGKFGHFLYGLSYGLDERPVEPHQPPRSRGSETTFDRDETNLDLMDRVLLELSEDVSRSLKKNRLDGRTVTIKVKYHDFKSVTRSRTLSKPIVEAPDISTIAQTLLRTTNAGKTPIRLLGVSLSNFGNDAPDSQLLLL